MIFLCRGLGEGFKKSAPALTKAGALEMSTEAVIKGRFGLCFKSSSFA